MPDLITEQDILTIRLDAARNEQRAAQIRLDTARAEHVSAMKTLRQAEAVAAVMMAREGLKPQ